MALSITASSGDKLNLKFYIKLQIIRNYLRLVFFVGRIIFAMFSLTSRSLVVCALELVILRVCFAEAKTQFLFESDIGLSTESSLSSNYKHSIPKTKIPVNRVPEHLQDINQHSPPGGNRDVINIIDPPVFTRTIDTLPTPQHLRKIPMEHTFKFTKPVAFDEILKPKQPLMASFSYKLNRPIASFPINQNPQSGSNFIQPQLETAPHSFKKNKQKSGHLSKPYPNPSEVLNYHFGVPQFYPLKVNAAVRQKHIVRTLPAPKISNAKQRVNFKKFKTFQSNIQQKIYDFEEQAKGVHLHSIQSNTTNLRRPVRIRRDTNANHKHGKVMKGNLLPVALTIMGENGELLTGKALLQHITVLLKNTSSSQTETDLNKFFNKDMLLSEKEFNHIMDHSMNLTDPVMLNVLGLNNFNDSSLLTNDYVNEYLNCIDSSKSSNQFKALKNKIDCMKQKMFDMSDFDTSDLSGYDGIRNLPSALVYADVMSNIKNLNRPKKGIAFYSLPVDELSHLQQYVFPIEDYATPSHKHTSSQYAPISYQNRKIYFNEHFQPRMRTFYVVKSDGRIYQMEMHRSSHQPPIFHGFPDIPNADVFAEGPPDTSFFESIFFNDK